MNDKSMSETVLAWIVIGIIMFVVAFMVTPSERVLTKDQMIKQQKSERETQELLAHSARFLKKTFEKTVNDWEDTK